jgi:hypothetical protein
VFCLPIFERLPTAKETKDVRMLSEGKEEEREEKGGEGRSWRGLRRGEREDSLTHET